MSRLKMMTANLRWVHLISFTKPRQVYCYFYGLPEKKSFSTTLCCWLYTSILAKAKAMVGFWGSQATMCKPDLLLILPCCSDYVK